MACSANQERVFSLDQSVVSYFVLSERKIEKKMSSVPTNPDQIIIVI